MQCVPWRILRNIVVYLIIMGICQPMVFAEESRGKLEKILSSSQVKNSRAALHIIEQELYSQSAASTSTLSLLRLEGVLDKALAISAPRLEVTAIEAVTVDVAKPVIEIERVAPAVENATAVKLDTLVIAPTQIAVAGLNLFQAEQAVMHELVFEVVATIEAVAPSPEREMRLEAEAKEKRESEDAKAIEAKGEGAVSELPLKLAHEKLTQINGKPARELEQRAQKLASILEQKGLSARIDTERVGEAHQLQIHTERLQARIESTLDTAIGRTINSHKVADKTLGKLTRRAVGVISNNAQGNSRNVDVGKSQSNQSGGNAKKENKKGN